MLCSASAAQPPPLHKREWQKPWENSDGVKGLQDFPYSTPKHVTVASKTQNVAQDGNKSKIFLLLITKYRTGTILVEINCVNCVHSETCTLVCFLTF